MNTIQTPVRPWNVPESNVRGIARLNTPMDTIAQPEVSDVPRMSLKMKLAGIALAGASILGAGHAFLGQAEKSLDADRVTATDNQTAAMERAADAVGINVDTGKTADQLTTPTTTVRFGTEKGVNTTAWDIADHLIASGEVSGSIEEVSDDIYNQVKDGGVMPGETAHVELDGPNHR